MWFFLDQSCTSLAFSTHGPSWLPGTSLVPSRILPDVHQGLQRFSCPSRTTGHWVGGWGKWRSFALLYFWPKCELLQCFAAGLPNNMSQSHPYRVKTEDRDICLDNCNCQFSVLTENFSVNEKKPFYTERRPWWLRRYRICLQCGRPRFKLWVWKISWRREWLTTPVFLPCSWRIP